jgi:hypothetical protein
MENNIELSKTLAKHLKVYIDDPSKRNVQNPENEDLGCRYGTKSTGNINSPGCFVGSFLPKELADKADDNKKDMSVTELIKLLGEECPEIITDNISLMIDFQRLHDCSYFFNKDKNLSDEGKNYLSRIIEKYKLDLKPFKKFL